MKVFEDLIEELKEENLIEETVIETSRAEQLAAEKTSPSVLSAPEIKASENSPARQSQPALPTENVSNVATVKNEPLSNQPSQPAAKTENMHLATEITEPLNESDFYRRRATEEVASLKIVEHVISGVEREMMKIAPNPYDDLAAGIALHDFLNMTSHPDSPEHALCEFKLMQETENWYSALAHRDKFVSVGDLRRYCETTRPVLSVQALIALARFYRNAPFTEAVRSKFDIVMTRLVTQETKNNKRQMALEREKLVEQISGLYEDWSSIPLYAVDDDPKIKSALAEFESFISEVKQAGTFEELINNEFFKRLRNFKDSIGDNFFSPLLLATAIDCNVVVGNRYVELIEAEREKSNSKILEEKYQSFLDLTVSDATSKTLQLIELLHASKEKEEIEAPKTEEKFVLEVSGKTEKAEKTPAVAKERKNGGFVSLKINKWLLLTAVLVFVLTCGLYIWVEYFSDAPATSAGVEKVNLEGTALEEYFKAGRVNENTLYAITQPKWKDLAKETKEDVLKKALADGAQKGYSKIIVLSGEGKTVGFASAQKGIEISDF